MRKNEYVVKYKTSRQFFWRKLVVTGDGIEEKFRFFQLVNGSMVHIPVDSCVWFSAGRQVSILNKMSKETGCNVQRD